jgi:hypothetical protein
LAEPPLYGLAVGHSSIAIDGIPLPRGWHADHVELGVRRRAEASKAELNAGLDFLPRELVKLARDYPEQAERLRILGSVEGIDERLGAATGER